MLEDRAFIRCNGVLCFLNIYIKLGNWYASSYIWFILSCHFYLSLKYLSLRFPWTLLLASNFKSYNAGWTLKICCPILSCFMSYLCLCNHLCLWMHLGTLAGLSCDILWGSVLGLVLVPYNNRLAELFAVWPLIYNDIQCFQFISTVPDLLFLSILLVPVFTDIYSLFGFGWNLYPSLFQIHLCINCLFGYKPMALKTQLDYFQCYVFQLSFTLGHHIVWASYLIPYLTFRPLVNQFRVVSVIWVCCFA